VDIADIKRELSSDEKLLESAFKLETVYKKYKFVIWGIAIALVLFFAGTKIMEAMNQNRLEEANSAFLTLQEKADDAKALALLKEKNLALYEFFTYAQAAKNKDVKVLSGLTKSSNEFISDASKYSIATIEKKLTDSTLYKEMALLEGAYLAIKAGDIKSAKEKLELIKERSPLSSLAQLLNHATLKVK
jgi:hypothetical protein